MVVIIFQPKMAYRLTPMRKLMRSLPYAMRLLSVMLLNHGILLDTAILRRIVRKTLGSTSLGQDWPPQVSVYGQSHLKVLTNACCLSPAKETAVFQLFSKVWRKLAMKLL